MNTIALFGAGKIGETIAVMLTSSGRYKVLVCDIDGERAKRVAQMCTPQTSEAHTINLNDSEAVVQLLKRSSLVVSALPFFCNKGVARAALDAGVHYVDLTEDVETTRYISTLAASSTKSCFMPQAGLAPGFISIAASHLVGLFDSVDVVKMRVGALPIYPTNRLKYNLTWSTDGLVNEYCNLCEAIYDGQRISVLPLEGYERFSLDGDEYEAFNTSGGLGTLCSTLDGRVRNLNYKTIRYPGHRDLVAFLLDDLHFSEDRSGLKAILERSVSTTSQDKVLILVEATGVADGMIQQKTYASTVYNQEVAGRHFGAIQVTTSSGVCGAIDLLLTGKLDKKSGLLRAEDIPLTHFLDNEFGRYYRDEAALGPLRAQSNTE